MKSETQTQSHTSQNQQVNNPHIHKIKPSDIVYEESESDSIERCPHDQENPYVMVSVELLRNQSLSPECRWLLCYLLSHQKGWKINRRQVANHLTGHCGRDKTDNIFNEAIDAGYMKRVDILVRREKGGALRRCKYFVSETPKFKKCFQQPPFQGPGFQGTGDTGDKVISSKEISYLSNPPPLTPPDSKKDSPKSFNNNILHSDNLCYVANGGEVESKQPVEQSKAGNEPRPKILLRAEEEDFHTYKILEDTNLSPKEKKRLTKQYTEPEVIKAVTISKTQKVKKSLMSLLINILDNPDKWEDASISQSQTPQQHIAFGYNKSLAECGKRANESLIEPGSKGFKKRECRDIAKENEKKIPQGYMDIVLGGFITSVSLRSSDFEQDIKDALAQLR